MGRLGRELKRLIVMGVKFWHITRPWACRSSLENQFQDNFT